MKSIKGFIALVVIVVGAYLLSVTYFLAYLWNEYIADAFAGPHLTIKVMLMIVMSLAVLFPGEFNSK